MERGVSISETLHWISNLESFLNEAGIIPLDDEMIFSSDGKPYLIDTAKYGLLFRDGRIAILHQEGPYPVPSYLKHTVEQFPHIQLSRIRSGIENWEAASKSQPDFFRHR